MGTKNGIMHTHPMMRLILAIAAANLARKVQSNNLAEFTSGANLTFESRMRPGSFSNVKFIKLH
jgi:hypothetical protein